MAPGQPRSRCCVSGSPRTTRLPEVYLVAASLHREALTAAFADLVDRGTLSIGEAVDAGRMVLSGNARRPYSLA